MALALTACATSTPDNSAPDNSATSTDSRYQQAFAYSQQGAAADPLRASSVFPGATFPEGASQRYKEAASVVPGTGNFINQQAATRPAQALSTDGGVTLNFEGASIREVVKVVFDVLQENYVIDPQVDGEVTVQTSRPLPREALIPTLETLLRMNNAALVRVEGVYKVVPISGATLGNTSPRLGGTRLGPGYSVRIFPLKYISAAEMEKILQPFAPEDGILHVDPMRNLLILAGTSLELANLQETINIFDVNWLRGMSVALYTLQNSESESVAAELESLFGESSGTPLAGLFRFIPVERINGILVITPQREYLRDVRTWIDRLDGIVGDRLYVYSVQNGDAEYIADILTQLFEGITSGTAVRASGRVAPGRAPASLSSGESSATQSSAQGQAESGASPLENLTGGAISIMQASGPVGSGLGNGGSEVRVIADTENNSLLIWADEQNYEKVLNALRKIDITPRQVLIEATIAEVALSDDLRYGFQWYFQNNVGAYDGVGSLDLPTNVPFETDVPNPLLRNNFSYALVDSAGFIRAFMQTLAEESKLRVLSSPQLMVIDNQEANFRVGNQVPVQTSTTVTSGGNTVESIEFKDTGVLLTVRPQVNAGGLVTMELNQEVTNVGEIDDATGQRSFLQRTINSKVAIQSGKTIVLGGLILESDSTGKSGIPILHKVPVLGPLFGRTTNEFGRTELIVLITPRVIDSSGEAEKVTSELRRRMQQTVPMTEEVFKPSAMRF